VSNQRVRDICGRILIAYLKESSQRTSGTLLPLFYIPLVGLELPSSGKPLIAA